MTDDIKEILEALQETKKDFEDGIIYSNCHYLELNYNEQLVLLDYITNLQKTQETLIKNDNEIITNLQEENKQLKEIIDKAIEYITSYESISTIQELDNVENNKDLDEETFVEMVHRYLKVHDKLLNILQREYKE